MFGLLFVVVALSVPNLDAAPTDDQPHAVSYTKYKVIRLYPLTKGQLEIIRQIEDDFNDGIDVWGESLEPNSSYVDVQVKPQMFDQLTMKLNQTGLHFTVKIDDLQSAIDQQKSETAIYRANVRRRKRSTSDDDLDDFVVGTFASHADINDWLRTVERRHRNIVEVLEIGRSFEGRPLLVAKIGERSTHGNKPSVWLDAGIHAREWIAPATAVYIIHALVNAYKQVDDVTSLLTKYDWYILPLANPDGYEYSNSTDRMWRKTRSRTTNTGRRNCVGVDGNRNFDFKWLDECERNPASRCRGRGTCENVFAGRKPFSEPETIAISNFIIERRSSLKLYVALHSYSQLWLTPWGYTQERPVDYDDLMRVATKGMDELRTYYNTDYQSGSPAVILYAASGGAYDWAKGVAGIKYSYTLELRDTGDFGFLLPRTQIVPTGEETFAGLIAAVQEIDADKCWVYGTDCLK